MFYFLIFGEIEKNKATNLPQKGENIETEIKISIREAYLGTKKTVVLKSPEGKDRSVDINIPAGITEKDKVRTIYDIQITEKKGVLEFIYCGDGFLQHMVRILSGTLLEVGSGKMKPEDMINILEAKERAKSGFMAPAKGLFLEKVDYE